MLRLVSQGEKQAGGARWKNGTMLPCLLLLLLYLLGRTSSRLSSLVRRRSRRKAKNDDDVTIVVVDGVPLRFVLIASLSLRDDLCFGNDDVEVEESGIQGPTA